VFAHGYFKFEANYEKASCRDWSSCNAGHGCCGFCDKHDQFESGCRREARCNEHRYQELPVRFREALILGELEELSFREIVEVMEIPVGSVMSALARGREQLRCRILRTRQKEVQRGLRG
jgi:hypothetical protein